MQLSIEATRTLWLLLDVPRTGSGAVRRDQLCQRVSSGVTARILTHADHSAPIADRQSWCQAGRQSGSQSRSQPRSLQLQLGSQSGSLQPQLGSQPGSQKPQLGASSKASPREQVQKLAREPVRESVATVRSCSSEASPGAGPARSQSADRSVYEGVTGSSPLVADRGHRCINVMHLDS